MLFLLSFAMAYAAFTALCLSMQRHQRDVFGKALSGRWTIGLRVVGHSLILAAYLPCMWQTVPSVAVVLWLGIVSAAALLLVAMLALKARSILWSTPMLVFATVLLQRVSG
jgi:phosphatidylglycerophosphate synthase